MRAHPPAPGQAAVRDAPAVHETQLPHRLHSPGPVRRGAEALQHHPPAQRDGVGGGTAVPLVPPQLPGGAADPRGAAGEASLLEVHPGAGPPLRRPGQGIQQVPADGCGGGGGRPGEAGPQRGRREPEEGCAPQGTAGQLPQGHADALRGTLSVGFHLTEDPSLNAFSLPWSLGCCLCSAPTQQSPLRGSPQGRCKEGTNATPSGTKHHPFWDRGTVYGHGVDPIRNARHLLQGCGLGGSETGPPTRCWLQGWGDERGVRASPSSSWFCIFSSAFIKHQVIL